MSRVALLSMLLAMVPFVSSVPVELEKRVTHTGKGTWFEPGLGNCGQVNTASDPIIAIPKSLYDQNNGSNCGQWIRITDVSTKKVVYGLTTDSCPGCGSGDLDMSPALFKELASLDVGVIYISWNFMPLGWNPT